jgi:nitrate reductase gamma subunit
MVSKENQSRIRRVPPEKVRAVAASITLAGILAAMIVVGSRNLQTFDAALVAYTFATLFAAIGITYRYAMWLQRPPTLRYWTQGWRIFLRPRFLLINVWTLQKRLVLNFVVNRFIWKRSKSRAAAHTFIMWGSISAAGITFPLVFGWIHFGSVPSNLDWYQMYVFGFATVKFPIHSLFGFMLFHGLVWSSIMVMIGVLLALRRRLSDQGAAALQQFGEDFLPLILLFAIAITGLMLTASYTWMKGYAYDFLATLHAVVVIFTLLWLPFGKFFHIFQRPLQLGVALCREVGKQTAPACCRRCAEPYASQMQIDDLIYVERALGYRYEIDGGEVSHYQQVCPKCRRALLAIAQNQLWTAARELPEAIAAEIKPVMGRAKEPALIVM